MMKNTLFSRALRCSNQGRAPVWLMRQAGRYLPEYRKIREKYSFLDMCKTEEIAASVTLLPIHLFQMDAAILFSDILVIPDALGLGLHFQEGKGPILERPLKSLSDVKALSNRDISSELSYVAKTCRLALSELKVPLIGFAGAPFTLATYMIEGSTSLHFKKTKTWMLSDPKSFHHLLNLLADYTVDYLRLQIEAGVHAIQIFDSWANVLSYQHFVQFSLFYLKKIIRKLKEYHVPVLIFCRASSVFLEALVSAKPEGISLDFSCDISQARKKVSKSIALQGNLDPDILYAPLSSLKSQVRKMLVSMKADTGYIFNLGHGIRPDVSVEAVKTVVETVKNFQ